MRAAIAIALAAVAFAAVLTAQRDQGLARDEVVYMTYGTKYVRWWTGVVTGEDGMVTEAAITRHFGGPRATDNNREHPPLMKTLSGLSELLLHRTLHWTGTFTAYRVPSAAMNAALVALVFLFCSALWGRGAGVLAALFTLLLPRAFFHAGLACFDAAVVTTWFATLYAYLRALDSKRWCVGLGVAFGLALATKHNAVMLPIVIAAHYAYLAARAPGADAPIADRPLGARILAWLRGFAVRAWRLQPLVFAALAVIGPVILIAVWPWLWFDTIAHLADWIGFHLSHVHYNYEYLGENWNAPPYPWHVPVVTTLFTVPVVTLLGAAIGAVGLWLGRRRAAGERGHGAPAVLLVLSAGVSMGPFVLGSVPIFGAEKHWAPAIPTLCVFAGFGVRYAAELAAGALAAALDRDALAGSARVRAAAMALCGALAVGAAAAETAAAQPYALSHYNALAGGAPGGADLGMNRQFWGYAARGVLPFLNAHAPGPGEPARPVYSHDASPAWPLYRREGLLAPGLPDAGREAAGVARSRMALVIHERHFNRHDYLIWTAYGTLRPAYVLTFQGVPIVSVYARPDDGRR